MQAPERMQLVPTEHAGSLFLQGHVYGIQRQCSIDY